MARRDRITLGIALTVAVLAVIGREFAWIAMPMAILAVFLIAWGREPKRTEEFIGRLPGGDYLLKALRQIDLVLSPRNLEQEQHFRLILHGYGPLVRQNIRRLLVTDDPRSVLAGEWQQFRDDRLVDHDFSGPSGIRPELKEMISRLLDEFGN